MDKYEEMREFRRSWGLPIPKKGKKKCAKCGATFEAEDVKNECFCHNCKAVAQRTVDPVTAAVR